MIEEDKKLKEDAEWVSKIEAINIEELDFLDDPIISEKFEEIF